MDTTILGHLTLEFYEDYEDCELAAEFLLGSELQNC